MRRAVVLAVLLPIWLVAAAHPTALAQSPEEIFAEGNEAYEAERYEAAIDAYVRVLRYGVRDARVEYNFGNAAFKLGRLGAAILHYERALRLAPTDPDVRANLDLARSRRVDRVVEPPAPFVVAWARGIQDRLGPDRQALLLIAILWAAGGVLGAAFVRPGGWSARAGWVLAALALVGALAFVSWRSTLHRLEGGRTAIVLARQAEVLAGPGENNAALFTVHEGLDLEIRAEREGWIQVGLPNGLNGWIPREAIGVV